MEAKRDLQDRAEGPERARVELPEVVAGDVLDHLAAGLRQGPVRERDRDPEDQVARGPVAVAQRTGCPRSRRSRRSSPVRPRSGGRARRAGRLRRSRRCTSSSRTPAWTMAVKSPCVVLDHPIQPAGRQPPARLAQGPAPAELGGAPVDPNPAAPVGSLAQHLGRLRVARGRQLAKCVGRAPSESLVATPARSSGCCAVRTGDLAAEPRRRKHLARIAEPGRIEGAAHRLHRVEVVGASNIFGMCLLLVERRRRARR